MEMLSLSKIIKMAVSYLAVLLDLAQILLDLLLTDFVLPLKAGFGKGLLFRFTPI